MAFFLPIFFTNESLRLLTVKNELSVRSPIVYLIKVVWGEVLEAVVYLSGMVKIGWGTHFKSHRFLHARRRENHHVSG